LEGRPKVISNAIECRAIAGLARDGNGAAEFQRSTFMELGIAPGAQHFDGQQQLTAPRVDQIHP
jgi:hypothetical protein